VLRFNFIGNIIFYSLYLLGKIPPDKDTSSDLAGFEISKLLKD